jgi:hypothetical protein
MLGLGVRVVTLHLPQAPNRTRHDRAAAMILEILFVVTCFLWFLSIIPVPQVTPYAWASNWMAFIAVVLLGLFIFMPGLR